MTVATKRPWTPVKNHPGIYRVGESYVMKWRDQTRRGRSESFRTLAEAKQAKGRRNAGEQATVSRRPFADYALAWVDGYQGRKAGGIGDESRGAYRAALERWAIPHFGRMQLGAIRPPDVKALIAKMQAAGLSDATTRKYVVPLKAMFAEAVEDGELATNPALVRVVGRPDAPAAAPKMLTPQELRSLRAQIPADHRDLFDFLAHTGCRISEAIGATWQRLERDPGDDKRWVFRVRDQFYDGKLRAKTKTAAGQRAVPLTPDMAARLLARRLASVHSSDTDPIFPGPRGGHLSDHNWRHRVFNPAAEAAGIPWATPHKLRHTLASLLLANGQTIEQIAAWLGRSLSSRMRHSRVEISEQPPRS